MAFKLLYGNLDNDDGLRTIERTLGALRQEGMPTFEPKEFLSIKHKDGAPTKNEVFLLEAFINWHQAGCTPRRALINALGDLETRLSQELVKAAERGIVIPKDDLPVYLEMARAAMRDMDFVIRNDLDLPDEELERLKKQLEEYLSGSC